MKKEAIIAAKLAEPLKVGDHVDVCIRYETESYEKQGRGKKMQHVKVTTPQVFTDSGNIAEIIETGENGKIIVLKDTSKSVPYSLSIDIEGAQFGNNKLYKPEWLTQSTYYCGADPFVKGRKRITFISTMIESILTNGGYGRHCDSYMTPEYKVMSANGHILDRKYAGMTHGGINFNPYVIDSTGQKLSYQRDLVWNLEQKQLLIHSIYNGIEIGKFIFKYNSWEEITRQMMETGHGFDFDCVDGKQRYHAILEFVQNKFPDEFGNYWEDLSDSAKRQFQNYGNLAMGTLGEDATYQDILNAFLTINFTGTPMSREHIEFVQKIKIN